jgi:hypothetical protein
MTCGGAPELYSKKINYSVNCRQNECLNVDYLGSYNSIEFRFVVIYSLNFVPCPAITINIEIKTRFGDRVGPRPQSKVRETPTQLGPIGKAIHSFKPTGLEKLTCRAQLRRRFSNF